MGINSIGEYLRARRELVRPDEVGIPGSGRRRVTGLRRDELALLAGISTEHYTRAAFLDSAVSDLFCDPEVRLENVVSALRASVGPDVDDPQLTELIGELSLKSADFRRLSPTVGASRRQAPHRHRRPPDAAPQVGELELHYDKFHLAGADRQMLTVYQAQPGSRSEQALTLLATIAADQQHRPARSNRDIAASSTSRTQKT